MKFVIFEVFTGEIVIEIAENTHIKGANMENKDIIIHTVGVLMKDLPILNGHKIDLSS